MNAPKAKPVICEELARNNVDRLTKTMKMAINSAEVCEQSSLCLALAIDKIDCFALTERLSRRTGLSETIDKIVNFIATKLVKFLIVIVFVQKKLGGGKRAI
jgi:hypothetical protein